MARVNVHMYIKFYRPCIIGNEFPKVGKARRKHGQAKLANEMAPPLPPTSLPLNPNQLLNMNEWFFANGTWRRDNIARHSSSLARTANAFPVFFILHPEFACDHRYLHPSTSRVCVRAYIYVLLPRCHRNFIFKIQIQKIRRLGSEPL